MSNKQKPLRKRALSTLAEPARLLRKLLMVLEKRQPAKQLPPAGERTGEGSQSLAPFLEEERNTKPGNLE